MIFRYFPSLFSRTRKTWGIRPDYAPSAIVLVRHKVVVDAAHDLRTTLLQDCADLLNKLLSLLPRSISLPTLN